jgi:DNA-binding cell septation regulator SpoVG
LFGVGLMHTPSNWGLTGEIPTNQPLLDWLAVTFVKEDKWSQKAMLRRLALSNAYQQASITTPKIQEIDPDNRLWTRMPLRRMSAEMLRDSLHVVSGTLDKTIGGTLLGGNDGDYVTNDQSGNKAQYDAPRRSLYLPVIRNAVYDFFQAFDFGDPSLVNARRASTIVAPQALFLLNSPLVANQARAFAVSVESIPDETARLENIYERAYSRKPTESEITRARIFMLRADELLETKLPDPGTRLEAIWSAYCQTILASNEMVYVR